MKGGKGKLGAMSDDRCCGIYDLDFGDIQS